MKQADMLNKHYTKHICE